MGLGPGRREVRFRGRDCASGSRRPPIWGSRWKPCTRSRAGQGSLIQGPITPGCPRCGRRWTAPMTRCCPACRWRPSSYGPSSTSASGTGHGMRRWPSRCPSYCSTPMCSPPMPELASSLRPSAAWVRYGTRSKTSPPGLGATGSTSPRLDLARRPDASPRRIQPGSLHRAAADPLPPQVHETVHLLAEIDRRATDSLAGFARWIGVTL